MRFNELKYKIKKISIIRNTYNILYGNRKWKKELNARNKALQIYGKDVIEKLEIVLKDSGLMYFADFGTLLGIIRDGQLLNWDDDIDYGIIINKSQDWIRLEKNMEKAKFHKIRQFLYDGIIREQTYQLDDLTVDFFGHFDNNSYSVLFGFYRDDNISYNSPYDYSVRCGHYPIIHKVKGVMLDNIVVSVPENSEEYLENVYSKNWKVPDSKWNNSGSGAVFCIDKLGVCDFGA